jgi:tetratricopeptide (TPR) repeat protein
VRKAAWLTILVCALAGGFWATLFLHPDVRAREIRFNQCAEDLSAACLADLGVTAGLTGRPPATHARGMIALRMMGRDAVVHALIVRAEELGGKNADEARHEANARLAAPRLADAVRRGVSPADAYAAVPEVRYGNAYIAALDLLGASPYGSGFPVRPPTEAEMQAVAGIAELLVTLAGSLRGGQQENALEYAAELYARLGQRDRALMIFRRIERDDSWHGIVSPLLMDADIGAIALERCNERPECRVRVLHRAAMVTGSDAEAEAMLREAFAIHLERQVWPDFDKMAEIVDLAVNRGNLDLALDLARELDRLAQSRDGAFPSFPHIEAARALLLSGAPLEDVRAALDRAEADMPGGGGAVIGLGHMGPITWGGGIGEDALRAQASLRAQIGDIDRAILLMEGIENPAYSWGSVLGPALPAATLDLLLPAAGATLRRGDQNHLRAQTAAEMFWWDGSPEQRDWALQTAREVMTIVDPAEEKALAICRAIARVAQGVDDSALWDDALTCAGQSALQSRDAAELLEAAALWFAYEAAHP